MAVKTLLPCFVNVEVHVTTPYYSQIYYIGNVAKVGVRTGFGIAFFYSLWGLKSPYGLNQGLILILA